METIENINYDTLSENNSDSSLSGFPQEEHMYKMNRGKPEFKLLIYMKRKNIAWM